MLKSIDIEEAGLYLTIRSFELNNPDAVEEIKILKSSSNGIEKSKKGLESLMNKQYVEKTNRGVKTTNKQF